MSRFFLALLLALPIAWPLASASAQVGSLFALDGTPASAIEAAVGGATAFAPTESPYAVQFNPALLAEAGTRPGLRFSTSLAPEAFGNEDALIGSSALSLGLQTALAGYPLTVGLGGSYTEFNKDRVSLGREADGTPLGEYDTAERASGGGLAIGWNGPVHIRVGGAAFYRESSETPVSLGNPQVLSRDNVTTLNLGTALTYDVLGGPDEAGEAAVALRITGGYTRRGIVLQEDYFARDEGALAGPPPPPEADVFGGSASVAFTRQVGRRFRFRVARADARIEFVSGDREGTNMGATATLFETLVVRAGLTQRGIGRDVTSAGVGIQIDGLVRAVGTFTENPRLAAFGDRLTLRGDVARYDLGEGTETDYAGFTLGWR